jgi:hypothetical protein
MTRQRAEAARDQAEADVDEAFRWYEAQRPGLGAALRRAPDIAVEAVGSRPATCATIHRNRRPELDSAAGRA